MPFDRLGAGAEVLAANLHRDDRLGAELEHLLGMARRVAQREPFAIGGDGAVQQAHAEVGQVQFAGAIVADLELAEVDLARLGLQFRRLHRLVGSLASS